MRIGVVALVLLITACSDSSPVSGASSTSTEASCRLPVWVDRADGTGFHGGFVDFPSGHVTFDPRGDGGRYYDWQIGRWLPVDRHGLSPDGSHYAAGGGTPDLKPILRIFDIATGAEEVYPLPDELGIGLSGPMVLGYTATSIYIGEPTEVGMQALWTFDLATHRTTFIDVSGLNAIDGTSLWRTTADSADQTASPAPGYVRPMSQIELFDLTTGSHTLWLHSPGHGLAVIGVDTNHDPIVLDSIDRQTIQVLVLSGPSKPQVIFQGSVETWPAYITGTSADSQGLWFGSDKGVYRYSYGGELTKVTDQAATPAGDCRHQS